MSRCRTKRRTLPVALLTAAVLVGPSSAAPPPFRPVRVSIVAREQPMGRFLQGLFSQSGLTAVISPNLTGAVNGQFSGLVSQVYGDVARAFDLLAYFDGARVYVYSGSEAGTRLIPLPPEAVRALEREAGRRRLADAQNRLQISSQGLTATGAPRFLDQIDEIAQRSVRDARTPPVTVDVAAATPAPLQYRVYYLRYGWAEDVTLSFGGRVVSIPGIASILRALTTPQNGQPAPMAQRTELQPSATVPGLRGQGLGGYGTLGYDPANGPMPNPLAQDGWRNLSGGAQAGSQAAPQGGQEPARVQADTRLNAVIVRDTRERLDAYDQLIRALDVEPQLLEIQATIIDIDIDKARDLGVNFRLLDDTGQQQLLFGNGGASDLLLRPGTEVTPSGRGAFLSTVIGNNPSFVARVSALETRGVLRVVSRPQVLTLSNVEAVFDASRTFYVRLAGERDVDLFNVTAGTTLRVTPHVTRDKGETRIRLLVAIEDGSLTNQVVDTIPVVERAGLNTQALILEGQSLLLGGMITEQTEGSTDQTPFLGDVPGLGALFRTNHKRSHHVERLFLITPRLASLSGVVYPPEGSVAPLPGPAPAAPASPPAASAAAPRLPS